MDLTCVLHKEKGIHERQSAGSYVGYCSVKCHSWPDASCSHLRDDFSQAMCVCATHAGCQKCHGAQQATQDTWWHCTSHAANQHAQTEQSISEMKFYIFSFYSGLFYLLDIKKILMRRLVH